MSSTRTETPSRPLCARSLVYSASRPIRTPSRFRRWRCRCARLEVFRRARVQPTVGSAGLRRSAAACSVERWGDRVLRALIASLSRALRLIAATADRTHARMLTRTMMLPGPCHRVRSLSRSRPICSRSIPPQDSTAQVGAICTPGNCSRTWHRRMRLRQGRTLSPFYSSSRWKSAAFARPCACGIRASCTSGSEVWIRVGDSDFRRNDGARLSVERSAVALARQGS
jgi:hypothetical protein